MLIPSDRPAYRILAVNGFYGPDDHLYHEGECILFDGVPNEEMEPLNKPAREALTAYSDMLDAEARKAAEKLGRTFVARPRTLDGVIAQAHEDARRVQLVKGDGGVPLMGGRTAAAGTIERLEPEAIPEDGRRNPKGKKGAGSLAIGA